MFTFPITRGKIEARTKSHGRKKLEADVRHSGGLTIASGATSVTGTEPRIKGEGRKLRLTVKVASERIKLLKLSDVSWTGTALTATGTLAGEAAAGLTAAFPGSTLFTKGLPIGTTTTTPGT